MKLTMRNNYKYCYRSSSTLKTSNIFKRKTVVKEEILEGKIMYKGFIIDFKI